MDFLLVKSIVRVIHVCLQKKVEDFTIFLKINYVLVKNFALVN